MNPLNVVTNLIIASNVLVIVFAMHFTHVSRHESRKIPEHRLQFLMNFRNELPVTHEKCSELKNIISEITYIQLKTLHKETNEDVAYELQRYVEDLYMKAEIIYNDITNNKVLLRR